MNKYEYDKRRVLELMNALENQTGKMLQDTDPVLEKRIWDAIDNKKKLTFFINVLARKIDKETF